MTSGERLSPRSLPQIQEWLTGCLQSHEACQESQDDVAGPPIWPSRLLEIANDGKWLGIKVINVGDDKTARNLQYLTLSHCWGESVGCKLLAANTEQYETRIPPEHLTKTFTQAIQLTRSLGFSYLWIDALCIVQDSAEDWNTECKRMGDIYAGGLLNISATSSGNGDGGLFSNMHEGRFPTFPLRFRDQESQEEVTILPYHHTRCYRERIDRSPLGIRGWVMQERLLSPRTIHFATGQIFWECHCQTDSEIFPTQFSKDIRESDINSHPHPSRLVKFSTNTASTGDLAVAGSLYRTWEKVVQAYTSCKLTLPSDKLPALSGLASRMARHWRIDETENYLAGLWRDDLQRGLMWRSFSVDGVAHPSRAPSWSWAYIDAPIHYSRKLDPKYVSIISASTRADPNDPHRSAQSGSLVIVAPLCVIKITSPKRKLTHEEIRQRDVKGIGEIPGTGIDDDLSLLMPGWLPWWDAWDPNDELNTDMFNKTPLFGVICNPHLRNRWGGEVLATILMVLEPTGLKDGQYRRVGLARAMFKDQTGKEAMLTLSRSRTPNGLIGHMGFEGQKGYKIEIV